MIKQEITRRVEEETDKGPGLSIVCFDCYSKLSFSSIFGWVLWSIQSMVTALILRIVISIKALFETTASAPNTA